MGDFAKRTLDRRASMIPDMLEARKQGKIAFLVMDQLITYDKKDRPPRSETEDQGPANDENETVTNKKVNIHFQRCLSACKN